VGVLVSLGVLVGVSVGVGVKVAQPPPAHTASATGVHDEPQPLPRSWKQVGPGH
jgi:hypothetical protein